MEFHSRHWFALALACMALALVQLDPTYRLIFAIADKIAVIGMPHWASNLTAFTLVFVTAVTVLLILALGLRGAVRRFKHGAKHRRIRRNRPTFDHISF